MDQVDGSMPIGGRKFGLPKQEVPELCHPIMHACSACTQVAYFGSRQSSCPGRKGFTATNGALPFFPVSVVDLRRFANCRLWKVLGLRIKVRIHNYGLRRRAYDSVRWNDHATKQQKKLDAPIPLSMGLVLIYQRCQLCRRKDASLP